MHPQWWSDVAPDFLVLGDMIAGPCESIDVKSTSGPAAYA